MTYVYVKIAASIITIISLSISLFQLLLVIGMPLGEYAWGGKYKILPKNLRIGSFISIFTLIFLGLVFLAKAQIIVIGLNSDIINSLCWVFTLFLFLNTLGNLASKSNKERKVMTPITLIAALSGLIVCIWA